MDSESLEKIKNFKDLKVLVLGDSMLDIFDFCYTNNSRPSPEKPGKRVYKAERSLRTLGGAGNVAANLATLGVSTVLISVCGSDGHFLSLRELASKLSLHSFFIQDDSRITGTKTRLYIDDEYLLRRDDEVTHSVSDAITEQVLFEFSRELKGADAVILSDYNKGFFTEDNAQKIIGECQEKGVPVIIDFKPKNKAFFRGATVIAPNLVEAQELKPGFSPDEDLEAHMQSLFKELQCENLFVTLGAKGICTRSAKGFLKTPAFSVNAIDAVGCGDTVRAALALGFASQFPVSDVCELANAAAAVVVQKLGTATLTQDELILFLKERAWQAQVA